MGQVVDGQVNLESVPSSVVNLSGDWRFYPSISSPEDISNFLPQRIVVPRPWYLGNPYKKFGYGLYHLRVKGNHHELLALSLDRVYSVYKIFVNSKLIGQCGSPSADPGSSVANDSNQPYIFIAPGETFDIYEAVANYWHAAGVIVYTASMGPVNRCYQQETERSLLILYSSL